jgi:hypothetical protein
MIQNLESQKSNNFQCHSRVAKCIDYFVPKQNLLFIWLKKLVDMLNRGINASSLFVPSVLSVFEFLVSCMSFEFVAA